MKNIPLILMLLFSFELQGQIPSQGAEVKKVIEAFFEGFHTQDSLLMKSVVADEIRLQSIEKKRDGEPLLHQETFSKFLKAIVGIPEGKEIREELHSFSIQVDGDMASVWTPYSFYFDGNFSHCGINNFLLIKNKGQWKIFHLVDTRRREGCQE